MKKGDYKWTLRRGSRKEICPACGQRRFVPYVAAADGKTMAGPEYGRCDREQNCGYSRYPNGVDTGDIKPVPRIQEKPLLFSPVVVSTDYSTPLYRFAVETIGRQEASRVWDLYRVGADGKRTVFWQISTTGEVRAGKTIPYKTDGHRDKNDRHPAGWCHYSKSFDGLHTGTELHQCFFGEHLLTTYPTARVRVVESEKTAIFMASYFPAFVWLASGGSQGLNEDKMKALEGRDVTLFPDNGQFSNWTRIAEEHYRETGQLFKVDNYTHLHPVFEGCDILDFFV